MEVQVAFADSLSVIWKVMIGVSGLGLLSVLLLKEVAMHTETNEKYGLHDASEQTVDEEKGISKPATSLTSRT